jgi:hypothetical protein
MTRGLLSAVFCVLITGTSAFAGASDYFSELTKDFGTTPKGPILTHNFKITNKSNQTITMGTPRIQCGCVSVQLQKATLAPGESTTLFTQLDTKKIPTQQLNMSKSVAVYVPFLSPVVEEVTIKVVTVCRDDLFISPDTLNFGTVRKGVKSTAQVKLTMFTQPNWEVTSVKSTGAYIDADFKLLKRQGAEVTYQVTATLAEDCPAGYWICDVWVSTNANGLEKFRVPVTVNVTPLIAASPSALDFGELASSDTATRQVILQAAEPFKLVDLASNPNFIITPVTEGSRALHIVKISVDPKATGKMTQKLQIKTDLKSDPIVIVPVSAQIQK